MLKFDADKLTGVQRKMAGQELEVIKRDENWNVVKPAAQKGDNAGLDSLAEQLGRLRANRIAAYPVKDLKPFGLDQPAAVVTLRVAGPDGKPADKVLKIGEPVEKNSVRGESPDRYAMVDGATAVAVLPGALADRLLAGPLRFRDRNIARFTDADKAVLERGSRRAVFAKVDGTWKMTEPLDAEAEQNDLEDFINGVARLRADELVAEKPADLKSYGLDRPEARWRFQSGDKDVLSLIVGKFVEEKGGRKERCYAKLANGDLVFLLDPQLTKRVLAEYRSRSVGTSIDASQVERVTYRYGRNPFVLEKVDNNWRVVGRADAKVNNSTVSDALAALANLKIERFVLDKGADMKLYGLEPPQLVLEVQTQSGTRRTLHIGHKEGDSSRYYARVPEEKRTDVFVISEADAAKIVRGLSGFLEGASRPAAKLSK